MKNLITIYPLDEVIPWINHLYDIMKWEIIELEMIK